MMTISVAADLISLLQKGEIKKFNQFRKEYPNVTVDLHGADLRGSKLYGANLHGVNLRGVNLKGVSLYRVDLSCTQGLYREDFERAVKETADTIIFAD